MTTNSLKPHGAFIPIVPFFLTYGGRCTGILRWLAQILPPLERKRQQLDRDDVCESTFLTFVCWVACLRSVTSSNNLLICGWGWIFLTTLSMPCSWCLLLMSAMCFLNMTCIRSVCAIFKVTQSSETRHSARWVCASSLFHSYMHLNSYLWMNDDLLA